MATEFIAGAVVSTFIERTIDNLASLFGDIFRGNKSKKKQLSNLKVKLLAIDVVVDDAEQKQFTNPRVRDWLLAAKGVMLDTEDLLEEIDDALSESQVEAESHSAAKKVWNFLKSSFVSFFENEIESRMEKLIENLEDLATQSHVLGLKKADDIGVELGTGKIPDSIDNLKHLRSLDLSHTAIEKLTGKICLLSHLQILKLNNCKNLKELPSNLHLLTNLCRLEFISTTLTKVPLNLGKLKNLKVMMDSYNVGHGRELGIQRLGELNNIHEDLSIGGLQNIDNSLDALEADLKNKTHIVKLKLQWDLRWNGNSVDSKKEEDVIENLQPSKNLKELSIFGYGGTQFPNWLQKNSLLNMVFLMLSGCKSCQHLPPLGLLPFLKHLHISQFDEIVSIDADFYGNNNSSSFESLETLSFSYMTQWEKWACKGLIGVFPCLKHLSISFCPKLKGHLPEQLFPLKTLEITECQQLEVSAPKALDLNLKNGGNVLFDWATVKRLELGGDNMEASFLEMVGRIIPDNSIKQLSIDSNIFSDSPKSDDSVSLWTFPLHFFPALKKLTLDGFSNLHMISHNHPHNHLQCLKIVRCHKFESLPGNMHMLFPSLEKLIICQCPRLESFPEGSLPSNLKHLSIIGCPAFESVPGNMHILLPSLNWLLIEECPRFKSFPEGFLPSNLEHLEIKECPEFESFPGNMHMLSLKSLRLQNCPRLVSFPDEVLENLRHNEGLLPLSFTSLTFSYSPNLKGLDYKVSINFHLLKTLELPQPLTVTREGFSQINFIS
ncbi:internalin A [Vigna unguiculata]|uniref:Internalin A n=1 Tax=Vigna unguiculata TaxID=3917 RepID=A0A4D6LAR4_VIGUN|nr:internalin A [Vigna unguiculata]